MKLNMPPREPDTVPILNASPFHVFPMAWQLRPPRDSLILVAKGTFDLVSGEPARPAEEQLLPSGELPFDDAASEECLRYPGDIAFFKPKADVFVVGKVPPPRGSVPVALVRVTLGRALDRSVAVIGERRWKRGAPTTPERFEAMELRADRAFGGPGFAANPIGRGFRAPEGGALPNIELKEAMLRNPRDAPAPALTTPIPATWHARARYQGTYDGKWHRDRWPYYPDDFDWRYFNAAAEPWQVPYPRGDETFSISGTSLDGVAIDGRLPGLRLRAFAQRKAKPDALSEVAMNLDTVWFDADERKLVLVWRGAVETVDPYGTDLASIFVRSDPWPESHDELSHRALFVSTYRDVYEEPEEEPEPPEEESAEASPPDPATIPRGLTPTIARRLGLPPWAATLPDPIEARLVVPEQTAPAPAMARDDVRALVASGASLVEADLSGSDLTGLDLAGRDLQGADLSRAQLRGASLAGADLRYATLAGADATSVSFAGARLDQADLTGCQLGGASFEAASMLEAVLDGAFCVGARFAGAKADDLSAIAADLGEADFEGASLNDADLSESRLVAASLVRVVGHDLRLYNVIGTAMRADDAELVRCRADGALLTGASFVRVKASDSSIRQSDLTQADFREAELTESVFEDSILERALFSQVEAVDCRWIRVRATNASFVKANLMRGVFESASFEGADCRGANMYEADTFRASFTGADLTHAIVGRARLK